MSRKRQHAAASVQEETYTYWPGPRFTCVEVITTKTIVRIIDRLYSAFGPGYETNRRIKSLQKNSGKTRRKGQRHGSSGVCP